MARDTPIPLLLSGWNVGVKPGAQAAIRVMTGSQQEAGSMIPSAPTPLETHRGGLIVTLAGVPLVAGDMALSVLTCNTNILFGNTSDKEPVRLELRYCLGNTEEHFIQRQSALPQAVAVLGSQWELLKHITLRREQPGW